MSFVGIILTAHDLFKAAEKSSNPLAEEVTKQTAGWGGAVLGKRVAKKGIRYLLKF